MNTAVKDKPENPSAKQPPKFVIGVRVLNQIKSELYNPGDFKLKVGMTVMVNTPQGLKMGVVASNKVLNFRKDSQETRVLRIANDNDFQVENRKHQVEEKARTICSEKIVELKLPMNLSRVVHQHHMNKTIFFFHIDFFLPIKIIFDPL